MAGAACDRRRPVPTRAGRGSVRRGRPAAVAPESPGLIVALGVGHVGSDGWAVRHSPAKGGEPVESGLFDVGFGDGGHGSTTLGFKRHMLASASWETLFLM